MHKNDVSKERTGEEKYLCENVNFAAKEAYSRLCSNIQFSFASGEKNHVLGVTSAQPSDGKSTTAVNLAYSLAQLDFSVVLIDCDMRRPSVSSKLGMASAPGLANLLTGENNISAVLNTYLPSDDTQGFDVIVSGTIPPNALRLLNSERMQHLLTGLSERYDYVILDLPPVMAVADAQTLSGLIDGMILVVREKFCPKKMLQESIRQLNLAGCNLLGFVLNGSEIGTDKKYSYYSSGYSSYYR